MLRGRRLPLRLATREKTSNAERSFWLRYRRRSSTFQIWLWSGHYWAEGRVLGPYVFILLSNYNCY
ncbi:hypothetical protein EYF80_024054 [Liparis tanakae]|uniref:Uncharacterized protein n=1 Tax=Liparis tanakae TaxID=230148 RepID=A0A4Z2HJI6_9TELE|nr:hypothetical protein EYF80_024054 [Liparis tanakae]